MSPWLGRRKQEHVVRRHGRLRYYAARDTVVFVKYPKGLHKLCRITFGADGSIYVQFPYLESSKQGLLAEAELDPNDTGPFTYHLAKNPVRVSTDVKFSHHTSGSVRFSKTGSVVGPSRQSFSLTGPIGHLFQLHTYRPVGFTELGKARRKVLHLGFNFDERKLTGVAIRAEWRRRRDIVSNISTPWGRAGPEATWVERSTGNRIKGCFLGQSKEFPLQDHVILLSADVVPLPSGLDAPGMIFLGGWDAHEQKPGEPKRPLRQCLAFIYPAEPALRDAPGGLTRG